MATTTLPFAELPIYIGRAELSAGVVSERHRHPHTELGLVLGQATLQLDLDTVEVTSPAFVVVHPGTSHAWACPEPVTLWVAGLKAGVIPELDATIGALRTGPHELPEGELTDVLGLLGLARRRFNDDPRRPGVAIDLLAALVRMLADWSTPAGPDLGRRDRGLVEAFLAAVEADGGRARSVTVYAGRLGLSAGHLTTVVSSALGRPPKDLIADRLVNEAKRLLVLDDLGAASVARRLEFADASQFGRWFRRHTGTTPGGFRAAHADTLDRPAET